MHEKFNPKGDDDEIYSKIFFLIIAILILITRKTQKSSLTEITCMAVRASQHVQSLSDVLCLQAVREVAVKSKPHPFQIK
jgi:hypothetical protein